MSKAENLPWSIPKLPGQFGSASKDDQLWVFGCTRDDVRSLIENPYKWIDQVNATIKPKPKKKIKLASEFVLRLRLNQQPVTIVNELLDIADKFGEPIEYIVQGISGTGVLMVRPAFKSHPTDDNNWKAHWDEWANSKTKLKVVNASEYGMGFGHLQLAQRKVTYKDRADRIAAFLLWGGDSGIPDSATGGDYYINRILRKTPSELQNMTGGRVGKPDAASGPVFKTLDKTHLEKVSFTYAGRQEDFPADRDRDAPTQEPACDDLAGCTGADGTILLDDVVVKSYNPT